MSKPLTRHACGFAIYDECDPATCQRQCFTARVVDINAKSSAEQARQGRLTLLALAVIVPILSFTSLYAVAAVVDRGIQNWQNVRTANVEP